ncbi:hypothetical protein [Paenibacillus sp.]|nr:hypothetical protein [Paenibacillus sp.]MDR0269797.1 hypothetical protein [Paenibacillus sp.]
MDLLFIAGSASGEQWKAVRNVHLAKFSWMNPKAMQTFGNGQLTDGCRQA